MIAFEFLGFLAGAGCAIALWVYGLFGDQILLAGLALFAGVLVGTIIPRVLFRKFLPAKCGEAHCNGPAFATGQNPIVYMCRRCSQQTTTNIFEDQVPDRGQDSNMR